MVESALIKGVFSYSVRNNCNNIKSMSKESTDRGIITESKRQVEVYMRHCQEWVCEMLGQSRKLRVSDAVTSALYEEDIEEGIIFRICNEIKMRLVADIPNRNTRSFLF